MRIQDFGKMKIFESWFLITEMGKNGQRSRRICFTLFDDAIKDFDMLRACFPEGVVEFIIGQQERCPNTQRIHWQVYVRFASPRAFAAIKNWVPTAHLEACKGSEADNIRYCSKEESRVAGPWEFGERSIAGKRKDLDVVREMVKEGKRIREISDVVSSYQALRFAESYINLQPVFSRVPPLVYWIHGSTGSGKTRWAYDRAHDCRVEVCRIESSERSIYFDPYVDEMYVLFDDFRPSRMCFSQLLAITDRYPIRVRVLYGTRQWLPQVIVFTCPYSIEECFKYRCEEDLTQLKRRVTYEILFGDAVKRQVSACASHYISI